MSVLWSSMYSFCGDWVTEEIIYFCGHFWGCVFVALSNQAVKCQSVCIDELWIATTGAFHHCCFSMFGSLTGGIKGGFSLKLRWNNMYYGRLYTNKVGLAEIWCHYLWNCSIDHGHNWHFRHRLFVLCRIFIFIFYFLVASWGFENLHIKVLIVTLF